MEISPTDVLEASEMLATRRVMSVPFGSESGLYIKRRFTSMVNRVEQRHYRVVLLQSEVRNQSVGRNDCWLIVAVA